MKKIRCKECGKKIHENIIMCTYCGCWIDEAKHKELVELIYGKYSEDDHFSEMKMEIGRQIKNEEVFLHTLPRTLKEIINEKNN